MITYTPAFLTSGSSVESDYTVWKLVTDGEFLIVLESSVIANCTSIDFSSVTDMNDVASLIQTAIRTETSSTETCTWDGAALIINSADTTNISHISLAQLAIGGAGTDISGSAYMDMVAGTITPVSAIGGMNVLDIYNEAYIQSDESLSKTSFLRYLNDGYRQCIKKIEDVFINNRFSSQEVDLTTTTTSFTLNTDVITIERVEDPNANSSSSDPNTIPIPETSFDEKTDIHHLRWYVADDKIYFRGVTEDIDDIKIYYKKKKVALIADSDITEFPDHIYDSILVDYVLAKHYRISNLETDWRPFMQAFLDELDNMILDVQPEDEPMVLETAVDDGLSYNTFY